jgi:LacI family transcriptional regulator
MGINDHYEHGIARGVIRYAKEQEYWKLYGYGWMFQPLEDLQHWKGDGIIARIESEEEASRLKALRLPVVDVAGAYTVPEFSQVNNDDLLTGEKAAGYLAGRGFSRFAFCGVSGVGWSSKRKEGFVRGLNVGSVPVFERELSWWEQLEHSDDLYSWLSGLSRPRAVFACNDTAGVKLSIICSELGIAVPAGIGILGVDNEDILCELSAPALSSINLDCEKIGYEAAAHIHRIVEEKKVRREVFVPPGGIIERETTNIFVCDDPTVEQAVRFITSKAGKGISVADTANALFVSRRSLEKKFVRFLGKSVYTVILETRIGCAKDLLRSTGKTVEAVAEESGFNTLQRFYAVFARLTGKTPGQFRRLQREV